MQNKQCTAVAKNEILAQDQRLNTAIIIFLTACDIKQTEIFVAKIYCRKFRWQKIVGE